MSSCYPKTDIEQVLEQLTKLTQQIGCASSLDATLAIVPAEARAILGSDRVLIYQLLSGGDGVVLAESIQGQWSSIQGQLIYDPCFETKWHIPYQEGRVYTLNDREISNLVPCYRELLTRLQVRANLVVPILLPSSEGDGLPHLWGLLIAHQCGAPRQWQPLDIQILQHIAMQFACKLQIFASIIGCTHHHTEFPTGCPIERPFTLSQKNIEEGIPQHDPPSEFIMQSTFLREMFESQNRLLQALQESEDRYRSVVTVMAEGVVLQQADGQVTACNRSAEKILGLTQAQIMGKTSLDPYWHAIYEDGSPFPGEMHPAIVTLRTGEPQSKVVMGVHKPDDSLTWISVNAQPLFRAGESHPYAVVTSFVDITAQKQAEANLRYQAEREKMISAIAQRIRESLDLDMILNTTVAEVRHFLQCDRVIIYRFNADWGGVVMTESVASGWNSILNMEIRDTYFVENRERAYVNRTSQARDNIYTAGLNPCHIELLEKLQVKAKLVVPIWQGDTLWGLLVAHQCDAPRHWQSLEQELLLQLATQVAIAIQQSELYGQVQHLNTHLELQVEERTAQLRQALEFEALLKRITDEVRNSLDEEQILQKVVSELAIALKADGCDTAIYNAEHTTTTVKYEYSQDGFTANNSVFTIANTSDPNLYTHLLQGQYCHFCLIHQNVIRPDQPCKTILACPIMDDQRVLGDMWLFKTADEAFNHQAIHLVQQVANQCAIALRQSRLYQAAQAQVEELARLNRLKDDFLSTVSHELRTPMATMKMAIQMLNIHLQPLGILQSENSTISSYFQILQTECDREISLINDLLDLTRIDSGSDPLNLTAIHLQSWLAHIAEPFFQHTHHQAQQLKLDIADDLPLFTTDLGYLERAMTELLHNAFKYTPSGEEITVSAHPTPAKDALWIVVSNTGVEIPEVERDRIFDKFYRIPNNDPWKHGGTGLGLSLVKKLVQRLGGTIWVESRHGLTQFIIQFPWELMQPTESSN